MTQNFTQNAIDYMNKGGQAGYVMDASPVQYGKTVIGEKSVRDTMAFLVGELEKLEPKLIEPLSSTTYARDIAMKPGGGWVEYSTTLDVDYATSGGNEDSILGSGSNSISRMQANFNKDKYQVYTFAAAYGVPIIQGNLAQHAGRNLEEIFNKGINLNYHKTLDKSVYLGLQRYGTAGLVNNPKVTRYTVDSNGAGTPSTKWKDKTPDQILDDVNKFITNKWAESEYAPDAIINHCLVSPQCYALLVSRKISEAGNISILNYILENNIAKNQGVDFKIYPNRHCACIGDGGTDRMVGYVNEVDKINFDLTVPLTRILTGQNMTTVSIDSVFAAQFSEVKTNYLQTIGYADGIN